MSIVLSLPPRIARWAMNLWPPFAGAGIRVRHIAPDFRQFVVEMPLRRCNRNAFGTHFGVSYGTGRPASTTSPPAARACAWCSSWPKAICDRSAG
jgi:hypothetical protein